MTRKDLAILLSCLLAGQAHAQGVTVISFDPGVADYSPAINSALASGSASLGCGRFPISSSLSMVLDGTALRGVAAGCSVLDINFASSDAVTVKGLQNAGISDITLHANVQRTSGSALHAQRTFNLDLGNLIVSGPHGADALLIDGSNSTHVRWLNCRPPLPGNPSGYAAGACLHAIGDFVDLHIDHGSAANWHYGVQITHGSGVYAHDFDNVLSGNGVYVDPSAAARQRVFGLFFSNFLGDTSAGDNWLFAGDGPITDVSLSNCWASASLSASGFAFSNPRIDGVRLSNSVALGNYGAGYSILAGRNYLLGNDVAENNSAAGPSAHAGAILAAAVSNVNISGGSFGQGGTDASHGRNRQSYGIYSAGASSLVITGANLQNNAKGGFGASPAAGDAVLIGNAGYRTAGGGRFVLPAGRMSVPVPTGLDAPDAAILYSVTPVTNPADAGISSYWVSPPSAGAITLNASKAATKDLHFMFTARAYGN